MAALNVSQKADLVGSCNTVATRRYLQHLPRYVRLVPRLRAPALQVRQAAALCMSYPSALSSYSDSYLALPWIGVRQVLRSWLAGRLAVYITKRYINAVKRVFKTKAFASQTKKPGLTDAALCQAVAEMQAGLIDADLGGGVVKKRVALPGRGKSGSARTLLATNRASRWFFVFGLPRTSARISRRSSWRR